MRGLLRTRISSLQGKNVDVINVRPNATLTMKTLRECRTEESYELIWKRADQISSDIKSWTQNTKTTFTRDRTNLGPNEICPVPPVHTEPD